MSHSKSLFLLAQNPTNIPTPGKRNTSLAFFTAHERSLLKSHWGSQSTRLHRDSFLPFASCNLCLQPSISPVACASDGEVFCRECIVGNLLAQKKEIQRLEKEQSKRVEEDAEREADRDAEGGKRAIAEFELTMMGLETQPQKPKNKHLPSTKPNDAPPQEQPQTPQSGTKRKFALDETTLLHNARASRAKALKTLDDEALAAKPALPSFWVPSLTPATGSDTRKLISASHPPKLNPLCPASSPANKHPISLKSLVTINFKSGSAPQGTPGSTNNNNYVCPACSKTLSNTLKAVMAVPCGHVLCKPCAGKFMSADIVTPSDPHAELQAAAPDAHADPAEVSGGAKGGEVVCYVCETDLTGKEQTKREVRETKKRDKGAPRPGTVELRSEGTGFAGGGGNMVKAAGTAFQC